MIRTPRSRRPRASVLTAVIITSLTPITASAAPTATWTNPAGGSWSDPSNWSPAGDPTFVATFNLAASAPNFDAYPGYTVLLPSNLSSRTLEVLTDKVTFSQPAASTASVRITAGTDAAHRSSVTLQGGVFNNVENPSVGPGVSTLNIAPDTVALTSTLSTGNSIYNGPKSATLNITGPGARLGVDTLRLSNGAGTTFVNVTNGARLEGSSTNPSPSSPPAGWLNVGTPGVSSPPAGATASAHITVDGPGSSIRFGTFLLAPQNVPDVPVNVTFALTNGATGEANFNFLIGEVNTTASALLDGPGTQFSSRLAVSLAGPAATLNINNGARLLAPLAEGSIGYGGGNSTINLSNNSSASLKRTTLGGGSIVGGPGSATINVASGSSLSTADLRIGEQITGTPASLANYVHGQVTVASSTPATSSLTSSGSITIRYGHLRIDPGGQVTAQDGLTVDRYGTLDLRGGSLNLGAKTAQLNAASSLLGFGTVTASAVTNSGSISTDGTLHLNAKLSNSGTITPQGGSLHVAGALTNSGTITLQGGSLHVAGALTNFGAALINGHGSLSAPSLTNYGQLQLDTPAAVGSFQLSAPLTNNSNSKVILSDNAAAIFHSPVTNNVRSEFRVGAGSTATFLAPVTGPGQFTGPGAKSFESGASSPSFLATAGSTTVQSPASLTVSYLNESSLTSYGATVLLPGSPQSTLGTLDLATTGTLDLSNNTLLLTAGAPATHPGLPSIRQYLSNGQLFSSTPDPDSTHSLGYLQTPAGLLIKLTPTGDANLDGALTADDFTLLDKGFLTAGSLWQHGDFNYDGTITSADYLLLDTTYAKVHGLLSVGHVLAQRESQFGPQYVSHLLTSIPEPSLVTLSILPLLISRRTHRAEPPRAAHTPKKSRISPTFLLTLR